MQPLLVASVFAFVAFHRAASGEHCALTPAVAPRQPVSHANITFASEKRQKTDGSILPDPELCSSDPARQQKTARLLKVIAHAQSDTCYRFFDVDVLVQQADSEGRERGDCSDWVASDRNNHDYYDKGTITFNTVLPGPYMDKRFPGSARPSVLQYTVAFRDTCQCFPHITTQTYFRDDPHRSSDPCKDCSSDNSALFYDCEPFNASPGSVTECHINLTLSDLCNFNQSSQPAKRCRPECMNGGTCVETGICSCAEGWTGALCDVKINPEPCTDVEITPCADMGPFYKPGQVHHNPLCTADPNFNNPKTMKMQFHVKVRNEKCEPLANMPIDIWQADTEGEYHDYCRSRDVTDDKGMVSVLTVKPGNYTGRPHHMHVIVHNTSACYNRLVVQGYFKGDALRSPQWEECLECHSDDPRLTMECDQREEHLLECTYLLTLQKQRQLPECRDEGDLLPGGIPIRLVN